MFLSASEVALAESDPFGLWHDHYGDEKLKDPVDEFDEFLREQGIRVEQELLKKRHKSYTDLSEESFRTAVKRTRALLKKDGSVIYQPALESKKLGLRARPDIIQVKKSKCIIEEYKLAADPEGAHELQASFYSYLLKKEYGLESECKVVSRLNEEFVVPYDESLVREAIQLAREILSRDKPPPPVYNCPSNWSILQNKVAKKNKDITLAWNIGAIVAGYLREKGIHSLGKLAKLDPTTLRSAPGMGPKKTNQVLNSARAQTTRKPIKVANWRPSEDRPEHEIFLDLEGSGELFQEDPAWNCIYLIGLIPRNKGVEKAYVPYLAKKPGEEKAILRKFVDYLDKQTRSFRLYHWHHYERIQLKKACERHGLIRAYDKLILPNLVDLCAAAQSSYVLPTPGWSIKVVAPYFGFTWSQPSSEVDAMKSAMMWFKQTMNGANGAGMDRVLKYNEDDCKAMIVVKDGFERLEVKHLQPTSK